MTAVILAAGYGSRLRPLTANMPKTMVEVAGERIIDRILNSLFAASVIDIVVVLGYCGAELRQYLEKTYRPAGRFTFVENADFATTNNIHSLALALPHVDDDFLLIECDLFYEPHLITDLMAFPWPNAAVAARYKTGMDGTVLSVGSDGLVEGVFPTYAQGPKFDFSDKYKTLNIYKFAREFLRDKLRNTIQFYAQAHSGNYYEVVLGVIIYLRSAEIRIFDVSGQPWMEIDDMNDLEKAEYLFLPESRLQILNSSHGGYWNFDVLDFCYIRNMYFPTPAMWSDLRYNLEKLLTNYGSAQSMLNRKLAHFLLAPEECCCLLSGASQGIRFLPQLLGSTRLATFAPNFDEYLRVFPNARCLDADGNSLDDLTSVAQQEGIPVVLLANPNNPTGRSYGREEVLRFIDASVAAGLSVIIDESFIDFAGEGNGSAGDYLTANRLPRVILVKSLSKSLGVPGLRLGYCLSGDASLIKNLNEMVPIWNCNAMAQYVLELLLKYRPEIAASFERTRRDREAMQRELALIDGLEVRPSGGNFVLCRLTAHYRAAELTHRLIEGGIYIKDCSSKFGGSGEYVRFAVRTPEDNQRLIAELRRACLATSSAGAP